MVYPLGCVSTSGYTGKTAPSYGPVAAREHAHIHRYYGMLRNTVSPKRRAPFGR